MAYGRRVSRVRRSYRRAAYRGGQYLSRLAPRRVPYRRRRQLY